MRILQEPCSLARLLGKSVENPFTGFESTPEHI